MADKSRGVSPGEPNAHHHIPRTTALLAGLRMLRLYFVKQYLLVEGKPTLRKRLLALYASGVKFVAKPSRDHFTPEHIFDMLEDATLIKFNEILRFRFDSGKSEFEFIHRKPHSNGQTTDVVFIFKTACVNDIKESVCAILDFLKSVVANAQADEAAKAAKVAAVAPVPAKLLGEGLQPTAHGSLPRGARFPSEDSAKEPKDKKKAKGKEKESNSMLRTPTPKGD